MATLGRGWAGQPSERIAALTQESSLGPGGTPETTRGPHARAPLQARDVHGRGRPWTLGSPEPEPMFSHCVPPEVEGPAGMPVSPLL